NLNLSVHLFHHQDWSHALNGPVDLVTGDYQRRCKADDVVVCLFGKHARFLQSLAVAARSASLLGKLDADEQPAPAYFFDVGAVEFLKLFHEVFAHRGGIFNHVFFGQQADCGAPDSGSERIAAKGTAMIARIEDDHN